MKLLALLSKDRSIPAVMPGVPADLRVRWKLQFWGIDMAIRDFALENLRGVIGGNDAGGFFGLADVGSVASVSGNDTTEGKTSILEFIQAGEVSVLDAFRSYIYSASVQGISEGFIIRAYTEDNGRDA